MKRVILRFITGFWAVFAASSVAAEDLKLQMPLRCELGASCVIQQFVDHDAGKGARDFACGAASYDGHRGTDFRVTDAEAFKRGVAVLAAAGGKVVRVRDGQADQLKRDAEALAATRGVECGNAVVIDHGAGFETQYCHMRRGSVQVAAGDVVEAGDVIGTVGLSGRTQFPHLHISLRQGNAVIDPFTSAKVSNTCGINTARTMWTGDAIADYIYAPTKIIDIGIANVVVTAQQVEAGVFDDYSPTSVAPLLVGYVRAVNLRKGDQLVVAFLGPNGVIAEKTYPALDRNKAVKMQYLGKKRPKDGWPRGAYSVYAEVVRDGETVTTDAIARRRGWLE